MDKFIKDKVRTTYENILRLSEKVIYEIPQLLYKPCEYKKTQELPSDIETWEKFDRAGRVFGKDKHFWFFAELNTPDINNGKQLELEFRTGKEGAWDALNPQGLVYLNGEITQGIDTNHYTIDVEPNKKYDIFVYFYTGMEECDVPFRINLKETDLSLRDLYYDLKVAYDAALCYDEDSYVFVKSMKILEQVCNLIDFSDPFSDSFFSSIDRAKEYIKREYYEKNFDSTDATVNYIGHTHIDVAWQWTLEQTREKVQRSFSTVLKLMEKYPEYIFMSSQPQLYEYIKEDEPELYEKIKNRVKEGRWEADGAMWLEADCNLSSGESLVRQIMYGKRFMKNEFGVDSKILWLPDVFGYSAAMPQILKKTGVDKFVTSKISWNETNKMPFDSFMWEGIDGTEIFTYFLTAQDYVRGEKPANYTTYVGMVEPKMNLGTWERYQQKDYNNETVVTFGFGDGGGGPTYDMLEKLRRLSMCLPGMPKAQISRAGDFLERAVDNFNSNCELTKRTPKWVGELYLEFHRGTYTSIAKNKKNNRYCEFLCQEAETLSVINCLLLKKDYQYTVFNSNWKVLLLNQFHDIIPGSSIKEVYDESDAEYAAVIRDIGGLKADNLQAIADNTKKEGLLVYNPNSFCMSAYVPYGDDRRSMIYAEDIPPCGWRVIDCDLKLDDVDVCRESGVIESKHYKICFDNNMNICSIYDKDNMREAVEPGKLMNRLMIYEDFPRDYDNWEITNYYKQKGGRIDDVQEVKVISGNGYGGFRIERHYMNSVIIQEIIVYSESRRIDVKNYIDWHEHHVLLKAEFPVNVHTNKAVYDIQFGNVERPNYANTSWEAAKFEVCAHKWGDLSETGYGVSILNDCKYGYSAEGNVMTLTLIKCGTFPNEEADQGVHEFTYSIFPHQDDFRKGETVKEAYALNRPMTALQTHGGGSLPEEYSLISSDSPNIVIETVKAAESGDGIIVRLFDVWNKKGIVKINFGFDVNNIYRCDLLENELKEENVISKNAAELEVSNFEIVTLKVV